MRFSLFEAQKRFTLVVFARPVPKYKGVENLLNIVF
jgi:hypothetical protein